MNDGIAIKLIENENEFNLKFSIKDDSLVINVSEGDTCPPINYSSKFSLSDLVKLSRYFKLFETLEELMPEIKNLCNEITENNIYLPVHWPNENIDNYIYDMELSLVNDQRYCEEDIEKYIDKLVEIVGD